jgi:hypothetical protein
VEFLGFCAPTKTALATRPRTATASTVVVIDVTAIVVITATSAAEVEADSLIMLSCLAGRRNEEGNHQQELNLESSLCAAIFKLLIVKDLVALTGIEPGLAVSFCCLQVTETTSSGIDIFAGISGPLYKTCTRADQAKYGRRS